MNDSNTVLNIGDLAQPITKLIEVVSAGLGALWLPQHIRAVANAESDAERIRAQAAADVALIETKGDIELQKLALRASARLNAQERRRQKNIEAILETASHLLPPSVSQDPVDQDWITQFFNYSQDVSNTQMQLIWARLLVGEVARPHSFSLRALDTLRLLRWSEARDFNVLCSLQWESDVFHPETAFIDGPEIQSVTDLNPLKLTDLATVGLIRDSRWSAILHAGSTMHFKYFDEEYEVFVPGSTDTVKMNYVTMTTTGQELRSLCVVEKSETYEEAVIEYWRVDLRLVVTKVAGSPEI